jgi:hypothetical protein
VASFKFGATFTHLAIGYIPNRFLFYPHDASFPSPIRMSVCSLVLSRVRTCMNPSHYQCRQVSGRHPVFVPAAAPAWRTATAPSSLEQAPEIPSPPWSHARQKPPAAPASTLHPCAQWSIVIPLVGSPPPPPLLRASPTTPLLSPRTSQTPKPKPRLPNSLSFCTS